MKRHLFTVLAALSLLLYVATCVLWRRSQSVFQEDVRITAARLSIGVQSQDNTMSVYCVHGYPEPSRFFTSYRTLQDFQKRAITYTSHGGDGGGDRRWRWRTSRWRWFEFSWWHWLVGTTALPLTQPDAVPASLLRAEPTASVRGVKLSASHAGFLCLFAVVPLLWLALLLVRVAIHGYRTDLLSRRGAGRCCSCGYDLRATPDRCPECGAVPLAPSTPRPKSSASRLPLRRSSHAGLETDPGRSGRLTGP